MLYNLKREVARTLFNWQVRGIFKTPPVQVIDAPLRIVSLLGQPTPEISMYLLAMKGLYRHLGRGRITIITDKKTVAMHGEMLRHHLPGITFEMIDEIDTGSCQKGGCWERLAYIIRRTQEEYVIQMDSDTLPVGNDLSEVADCIEHNISFTYADNHWRIESMAKIAENASAEDSKYVGDVLERKFATWPNAQQMKFVKGSAGFSGFARGQFDLAKLEYFHTEMKKSLGNRWREWGTEQSASNFLIANAPGAVTLPYPAYQTGPLPTHDPRTKFIHFIGSNRYRGNVFAKSGRRMISELMLPQV